MSESQQTLPASLQPTLDAWCDEVRQELTSQRQRREPPQYDKKLGFWCGCQGYNPYYTALFHRELVLRGQPGPGQLLLPDEQLIQPLLDALYQTLAAHDIVPIHLEIGKDGFALRAVREDRLLAQPAPDGQSFLVDALFALFL